MHRSESIILSKRAYRDADVMLTLFTREDGKVGGVARSAKKSNRRFGGILETGYILDLHYSKPLGRDMVNLEQASLVSPKQHRETTLAETHALWLGLEMAARYLPDAEVSQEKYELLRRFTLAAHEGRLSRPIVAYFLSKWISLAGFMPDMASVGDGAETGHKFGRAGLSALKSVMSGDVNCDINDPAFEDILRFTFKYSAGILGRPLKLEPYLGMLMEL